MTITSAIHHPSALQEYGGERYRIAEGTKGRCVATIASLRLGCHFWRWETGSGAAVGHFALSGQFKF